MPDIWQIVQIVLDESSPNPYWQTWQTILSLVEMIHLFCLPLLYLGTLTYSVFILIKLWKSISFNISINQYFNPSIIQSINLAINQYCKLSIFPFTYQSHPFLPLPSLQWSRQLKAVAFSHPYVLALSDELVTIHSILDFSQKQAISFIGGVVLGDFDGKIFIASPR